MTDTLLDDTGNDGKLNEPVPLIMDRKYPHN
jgi:hypothetical protein